MYNTWYHVFWNKLVGKAKQMRTIRFIILLTVIFLAIVSVSLGGCEGRLVGEIHGPVITPYPSPRHVYRRTYVDPTPFVRREQTQYWVCTSTRYEYRCRWTTYIPPYSRAEILEMQTRQEICRYSNYRGTLNCYWEEWH